MGTVYKAMHHELHRAVALKVIAKKRAADARIVGRFQREIAALRRLDHPNVVRQLDAGSCEGVDFVVMEYVDGLDLSRIIARCGALAVADACEIARQAAEGLQHVHGRGMIHRDIKPANLCLSRHGDVKIVDFGLVLRHSDRPADDDDAAAYHVVGSFDYMAPEQAIDCRAVDARVDIFSLGATLYYLLTGKSPFADKSCGSPLEKSLSVSKRQALPIDEHRGDIPRELRAIVARMLAARPDERFASAAAVAAALRPFAASSNLRKVIAEAKGESTSAHVRASALSTTNLASADTIELPSRRCRVGS
jgi:serine/threonine protein kinase